MSNTPHYFHFTLGPVQGFVAQARRTRDFWAGSFILSWLSAVAIKATQIQGGEIKFPLPDDDYMSWLEGKNQGKKPIQGSIPNRFKAEINSTTFKPEQVVSAVQEAWKALADTVWERDLGHISPASQTATIWDRQISAFWDMSWIITDDPKDSSALDKRKNWRSYCPPNEPGVKCSIMDGWQELSGANSPNREAMNHFWSSVQNNGRYGMKSDLAKNEALCAMAFVKRRFSRHFDRLDHSMAQGWRLKGWKVPSAVPSVTYMAAVHWLEHALNKADANTLANFHQEAERLVGGEYGEWETRMPCLESSPNAGIFKRLRSLDGGVFFDSILENKNHFEDQEQAKKVQSTLAAVRRSANNLEPVSPFYAILLMDGDSLGKHMSDTHKQPLITQGLAKFTLGVPAIVYNHNGFLVYAGGDDVLAILPLEDAIPCAVALRKHYLSCFDQEKFLATISGAIEFVHIKTPLTEVLKDSHKLLDEVAKEGRGRDALAIRVWKPGGLQIEWAQPWDIALAPEQNNTYLELLVKTFRNIKEDQEQFASKFFYKIRERFELLNPSKNTQQESVLDDSDALSLMAMEYLNSGKSDLNGIKNAQERMDKAKDRVRPLLTQCRPVKRKLQDHKAAPREQWDKSQRLEVDGALLVRFLARKGVER